MKEFILSGVYTGRRPAAYTTKAEPLPNVKDSLFVRYDERGIFYLSVILGFIGTMAQAQTFEMMRKIFLNIKIL
jgi:hypothetical protein